MSEVFNPQLPLDSVPVGAIIAMETASAPTGWLLADGSTFDAAEFPDLNTYLGGTTLPDYRDRMMLGAGTYALSVTGGALDHVHTQPLHDHTQPTHVHSITHTHTIDDHNHSITHTHQIDPPNTTSAIESQAPITSLGLLGIAQAADDDHTHDVDIAEFTSGGSSAANSGTDGPGATNASSAANTGSGGDDTTGTSGNDNTGAENPPFVAVNWFIKAVTFTSDGGIADPVFYAINFDDVGGGVSYAGFAAPGSIDSASVWQVRRITETGLDSSLDYADGDSQFDNVWDDRLILSYS